MKLTHEQARAAHEAGLVLEYMDKDNQEWCARASHEVRPRAADVYRIKPGQPHADVRIALAMGKKCELRKRGWEEWYPIVQKTYPAEQWADPALECRIAESEPEPAQGEPAQPWARERKAHARGLRVQWNFDCGYNGFSTVDADFSAWSRPHTVFRIHPDDEAAFQAMEQAEQQKVANRVPPSNPASMELEPNENRNRNRDQDADGSNQARHEGRRCAEVHAGCAQSGACASNTGVGAIGESFTAHCARHAAKRVVARPARPSFDAFADLAGWGSFGSEVMDHTQVHVGTPYPVAPMPGRGGR